jgi:hypothetical protein
MGNLVCYVLIHIISDCNTRLVAEELLIDFRELLGEHSGENMAEAVWETLVMYGIEGRVVITCDLSKLMCLPRNPFLDSRIHARQHVKQ